MIQASKFLKDYIQMHGSNEVIATRWDVTRQTIHNILKDEQGIGTELMTIIMKDTGFEFEKAFDVKEVKE